jgi:hypothetical protein
VLLRGVGYTPLCGVVLLNKKGIKMNIVNLTPHDIVLCGNIITSSGVARCETTVNQIGEIDGIKINKKSFGEVTGLPEAKADTIYVVSAIVA